MKLWGGRFEEETGGEFADFNSSLSFDFHLYPYDIEGSRVHAKMLARQDIISEMDAEKIISGLDEVESRLDEVEGWQDLPFAAEDIHSLVEGMLKEEIGSIAGKLHTARSRNDQIALDIKLYLRDRGKDLLQKLVSLVQKMVEIAADHKKTIMPGYTHLQPAQPITLAHHLLAHAYKFKRDYNLLEDCLKHMDSSPLGSGALAATSFPLDREWTAEALEFSCPTNNSLDAVSNRDFLLEFQNTAVLIMTHLSSISEEIVLWNTAEFNFIEISDRAATGSSIMPQKKNPDIAELIRGKSGRVLGNYNQLAHTLKSLPLAYNKDLQEDKEGLFDTVATLEQVLPVFSRFLEEIEFLPERMREMAEKGYLNATELADYLAEKGIPFREAHEAAGRAVRYALESEQKLEEIELSQLVDLLPLSQEDIDETELKKSLEVENAVASRNIKGGPAPEQVAAEIKSLQQWIEQKTTAD